MVSVSVVTTWRTTGEGRRAGRSGRRDNTSVVLCKPYLESSKALFLDFANGGIQLSILHGKIRAVESVAHRQRLVWGTVHVETFCTHGGITYSIKEGEKELMWQQKHGKRTPWVLIRVGEEQALLPDVPS